MLSRERPDREFSDLRQVLTFKMRVSSNVDHPELARLLPNQGLCLVRQLATLSSHSNR